MGSMSSFRSHQCVEEGRGFEVMHDQHLVRVFSARDYEGHRNDASIISIRKGSDQSESCAVGPADARFALAREIGERGVTDVTGAKR